MNASAIKRPPEDDGFAGRIHRLRPLARHHARIPQVEVRIGFTLAFKQLLPHSLRVGGVADLERLGVILDVRIYLRFATMPSKSH